MVLNLSRHHVFVASNEQVDLVKCAPLHCKTPAALAAHLRGQQLRLQSAAGRCNVVHKLVRCGTEEGKTTATAMYSLLCASVTFSP